MGGNDAVFSESRQKHRGFLPESFRGLYGFLCRYHNVSRSPKEQQQSLYKLKGPCDFASTWDSRRALWEEARGMRAH